MDTYYKLLSFFFLYAFLGWCAEVVYATILERKFVNRGFLSGPVCPIYGFGVLFVLLLLKPLSHHILLLFLGSVLLTSALEFLTGFVLEKVFNDKWWDYSHRRFQILGYVCLEFSLLWGAACVLVVRLIHPVLDALVSRFPSVLGKMLPFAFLAVFLADAAITVSSMLKLKRNLRLLREISRELKSFSDEFGEKLSEGVLSAMEFAEEEKKRAEAAKEKYLELKTRYQNLLCACKPGHRRLLCAFPCLQRGINREAVEKLRLMWEMKRRLRKTETAPVVRAGEGGPDGGDRMD